MLSYCDISTTPAFQYAVAELTPELGDRANKEVFRDYLEYNGKLREPSEILAKLSNDYFSTVSSAKLNQSLNKELEMTQSAKFKELGRSVPKKQLSDQEIQRLKGVISKTNNDLVRKGINRVYKLEDIVQVGQSDNFTWKLSVYPGKLDVAVKADRLRDNDYEKNWAQSILSSGTQNLKNEIKISYGNEANFRKNLQKAQSQSNKLSWDTLFGNVDRFRPRIIQALKRNTTIYGNIESQIEGRLWGRGKRINSIKDLADMYLVHRSPLIEKLHFIYLRGGVVIGTNAYTAGLVNRTPNFDQEGFKATYEALSADEVYILHNHPSGNHLPSPADITMTSDITSGFPNINFKGQLVIDTDKFTFIPSQMVPDYSNYEELSYINTPKKLTKTRISLGKTKTQVIKSLKEIGDLLLKNDKVNAVIYLSTYGEVVGYDGFLNEDVDSIDFIDRMKKIGAFNYVVFSPNLESSSFVNKTSNKKYSERVAFYIDGNTMKGLPGYDYDLFKVTADLPGKETQLWEGSNGDLNTSITTKNYSQEFIRKYADTLKLQIGVDYDFITSIEAQDITKDSKNPWSGQKSFFYQGKIHFIEGQLTPDDVLHEYIHPVIKSLTVENKSLFDNLYSKLTQTQEGQKTVEEVTDLYPDLEDNEFKQEVLVRSLAKIQDLNNKGLQVTSEFKKFIDNLLYAIKQFLRKTFGQKIQISKLDQNTTLKQLSDILESGGQFELDPTIITDDELVQYKNEYNQYLKDFVAENADTKEMKKLTNDYFDIVGKHIKNLRDKNDLGDLVDILQNNYKTGELQKMKQNLKSYQTLIQKDSKQLEDEVELTRQRTNAVINSLGNVDNMTSKILLGLRDLVKDIDNPDNVQRVLYYQKVLNYWGNFVNTANRTLEANGVRNIKMIDNVNASVRRANDLVNDFYTKASKGVLWNKLKSSAENIDKKWEQHIKKLRDRNEPEDTIAKAESDAKKEKITPEQIEQALKGELKDLNFANAYLEGYSYSPDPVVGGLALFVKDKTTEIEVKSQAIFNDAITKLKPLLDKVGYNPNKPGEIGEKLGQKEKVGKVNLETGEFEEREVWRFLNEFTGADLVRDQYLFKVKQAGSKYAESGSETDKKALADIQSEWEQHRRDYFHQEYTEPFYKAYDVLKKDEIGNIARMQLNDLYDELNSLSSQMVVANTEEILEIADQVEAIRRQIKQLSSLYDLAGNLKEGQELIIAKRLQEFNEAIAPIYRSEEIPHAFQNAYLAYSQKLKDEGKKAGTLEYDQQMQKWLDRNTRTVIKEEFWTKMDTLNKAIKEILSTIPQQDAAQLEIEEAYKTIKDMVRGNRDESGQPLGNELSPERQEIIKRAQERINSARESLNSLSGLAKHEQDQINAILARMSMPGQTITQNESLTLSRLFDKQSALSLGKVQRAELNSLFNELDELRSKEPTDAYIDAVNNLLAGIDDSEVYNIFGSLSVDRTSINRLKVDSTVQTLSGLSNEFKEWFERNHTFREVKDHETNEPSIIWERTYAWSVIKPIESKYYESTSVKDSDGNSVDLKALPSLNYYKRLVKDEFITKKIEGVTVDNKGYGLPKTLQAGAKDDRYQNKDYDRIRKTDPNLFNLLEATKKIHLDNQKGLNRKAKLYLDMPRYRKQITERLQSENPVNRVVQRMKDFWVKTKDAYENGFNFSDDLNLIKLDLFDDDVNSVPITGISDLNINEVSTDAIFTTMKYALAAQRAKGLQEIAPMARMIQQVVNNEENYPLESKVLNNSTLVYSDKKKSRYLRARAVNNYLETVLEGKTNTGFASDSAIAQNISNFIFKRASSAFLDFNIPSALKNSLSAKFQIMIESSAGKHLTFKDFIAAEKDATVATMKIATEIYSQGPKSLDLQIIEIFDPERDRFHNTFGEAITRTPYKDYSFQIMGRLNDFRRVTQLQTSLQALFGMMRHEIIPTETGNIAYKDAWQLVDNKIQLKPGIDPTWGITYDKEGNQIIGDKFKQKRNEYNRVIDNINGSLGKEDRPEADRYLLFRYISFFRRFLTSMITNRFAKNRPDYTYGDYKEGFYVTFTKLMLNTFKNMGKNLPHMSAEEKAASIRLMTEVGSIMILKYVVLGLILGYDDDDKDRFKKLKANSDSLPLPFVFDDPKRPFDFGGWFENHAVLQTMQIAAENDQFLPFPGLGLNQIKDWFSIKSLALGPTLNTAVDLLNDSYRIATGDDKAYYQKASGSYEWNQAGDLKLFNHLAKAIGFSSSTIAPDRAVQIFENFQNR